jgi:hypothetical protein
MDNTQITKELHVCMGLNSCKNQGYSGNNNCAGMGDCSTVTHPCHTLNECKGQGGCGLFGTTEEFCFPSQNECRYQGSCGAPILNSRFVAQGPNKGLSVWQLARKRFEEKRKASHLPFGAPPAGPYGPSNEYVNQIKNQPAGTDNSSCGQSGSRSCSYIADPVARKKAAEARVLAMEQKSAADMNEMLKNCPPRVYE